MIDDALLFELRADSLFGAHFFGGVEFDAVGVNLGFAREVAMQFLAQRSVVAGIGLGDVEDDLIEFMRVVVDFAQFELPGADVRDVVEDVLELVEIHERALEFVEAHLAHVGVARNIAD